MSSDAGPMWGQIIILIAVIFINAYFAAAETAIKSVNKSKIKSLANQGNRKAELLSGYIENPDRVQTAMQVVLALAGFYASVKTADLFAQPAAELLSECSVPCSEGIAMFMIMLILSFVMLVFGVFFPKRIAMLHAERMALGAVKFVRITAAVIKPFAWLICITVTIMLKICRQKTDVSDGEYSEDDVVSMLEAGQERGELKEEGKKMITSIFEFDDLLAYEVMTPRTEVFSIDINAPTEEYIDELMELRYSRIPVYEDDSDNIIGILHIKDYLIKAREEGFDNVDFRSILRTPYFVPETKNIDSLFVELQTEKQHIAVLIDEYGGFSGIVTMEDIIEEIVGDIDDEYDEEETEYQKVADDTYVIDGSMDLDDLDEELGADLESENSETLGGFILDILGEIPDENSVGKEIVFENYVFRIDSIKDRRIDTVTMKILPAEENAEAEEGDGHLSRRSAGKAAGKTEKSTRHDKQERHEKHNMHEKHGRSSSHDTE